LLDASTKRLAVELLVRLVEVESPTFREEKAIRLLESYVYKLGFERVEVDPIGNLIAEVGGGPRVLLLAGHIDTVDEPLKARVEGEKLVGRGAVDAKGPLAAMTMAAYLASRSLDLSRLKVVLAALVGEEGPSHGAKGIVGRIKADYIVVGEPTGLNGVVIGCRGSCKLAVTCRGSGGHTANPHLYESPCMDVIRIVYSLKDLAEYTITPVYVECGSREKLNVIPKTSTAIFNARIPIGGSSQELRELLDGILSGYERCSWTLEDCTEPFKANPNNPAVRAAVRALLQLGLKPRIAYKAGTSDMTILSSVSSNIVEIGPGRPELSHTDFEEIAFEEYLGGISVYYKIIENLAGSVG